MFNSLLKEKNISMYRLSKDSGIPYTTINDICSGKTQLEKCSAETVYKIASTLRIPMEALLEPYMAKRNRFELFKSSVCHKLKEMGDIDFVIDLLENDEIHTYYKRRWYPECFYLLAMLDYLSRINNIPRCTEYDNLRRKKLQEPLFPASVLVSDAVSNTAQAKERALQHAIPEFMRFNIVESEVRNVI